MTGYPSVVKSELLSQARNAINASLQSFLARETKNLNSIGNELAWVSQSMERYVLSSGKRLRPLFAYVGYLGTANKIDEKLTTACASLELIHVCALMHDDLMDASDTRRGLPSLHREFENLHRLNSMNGRADQFGASAAILLGDLALVWSAKMFHESGLEINQIFSALPIYDELRVELMAGQYLDVYEQTMHTSSLERSLKIARYKSGKYTIERPLHFGAALSGSTNLFDQYSKYGLPLGEAFQLRDDVLGVFGESELTGKPTGDDILEGKRTALIAKTYELATPSQAMTISSVLGNKKATQNEIEKTKEIIQATGALDYIENLITDLTNRAISAVQGLPNEKVLVELAEISSKRSA